jgi:isopentenyl diphosphate isomerase/L-lactate dehydrogenase-like FMN-dependent dehydrogenase
MIVNIADLRRIACRRLPRAVFDYVDGGAEDEVTLRANADHFRQYTFRPRILVDVSQRDLSTTLLGERLAAPLMLAATGLTGLLWPEGEQAAARAAANKGLLYAASTMSVATLETIAAVSKGPLWFQLYVWRDREITRSLIERARAAGYRALCLTVDTAVLGQRERDLRNGFTIPPRVTVNNVLDTVQKVGWIRQMLSVPRVTFGNFVGIPGAVGNDAISLASYTTKQFDPSVTWDDLDWFRSLWNGPMALKGVQSAEDARRAVDHGVEAIIVSNHGGRQLDGAPAAVDLLPEVVEAVDGRAEIILEGGVRRGSDIVKALALGARAVSIGRPYLYGVAAGGQAGVERAIDILTAEMDRCMALIGRPRVADLDRSALRWSGGPPAGFRD